MYRVLSKEMLAPDVARLWIDAPHVARNRRPGQFAIIRLDDEGERIPLTIADCNRATGAIAFVVQGVGKTTRELIAREAGEMLLDVAGPLGKPTDIGEGRRVCCIGGGIGTAVVYPIACGVKASGGHVTTIVGARTRGLVILEDDLRRVSEECMVVTDDGSYGTKGLVTDALKALLDRGERFDEIVAVGPVPMMNAVCQLTRPHGIKTIVSLNPIMVDGTGMCGGCRVSIAGEPKFVCVDGPEFDGHQVDFAELSTRLRAYRDQETAALEEYERGACGTH